MVFEAWRQKESFAPESRRRQMRSAFMPRPLLFLVAMVEALHFRRHLSGFNHGTVPRLDGPGRPRTLWSGYACRSKRTVAPYTHMATLIARGFGKTRLAGRG